MLQQITSRPYENSKGEWDIEIEYDENPKGDEDYGTGIEEFDTRIILCKIRGPNEELFTYKVRFAASVIATETTEKLGLGKLEERMATAIEKTKELIDDERYLDLIITRAIDGWTDPSDAPNPLIKHS